MSPHSPPSRRQILTVAASTVFVASAIRAAEAAVNALPVDDDTEHPWIDAHSHIWTTDLAKYPLRDHQTVVVLEPRSFTDEELMTLAMPQGVGRVVLIQHYPHHGYDNSYLIDTWKKQIGRAHV